MSERTPEARLGTSSEGDRFWKEKRRKIIDELAHKVRFVSALIEQSEMLSADDPHLKDAVENIWAATINHFSPEIVKNATRYIEISNELQSLQESLVQMDDDECIEEPKNNLDQSEDLENQLDSLRDGEGHIYFIVRMRACVDSLLKKIDTLKTIPDDTVSALEKIKELYGNWILGLKKMSAEDVDKIIRGPFGITIVVEPDAYVRLFGQESVGLHFKYTLLNVVQKRPALQEQSTIRHENVHNLTDGSIRTDNPEHYLHHKIYNYKKACELGAPQVIVNNMLRYLSTTRHYINLLHGEIVAAFEHAEESGFIYNDKSPFLSYFQRKAFPFQTAGNDTLKLIESIEKEEKTDDQRLKAALAELKKGIKMKFMNVVGKIERSAVVSELLGEKARNEVEILLYILQPSKYNHIPTYLAERYGQEEFLEKETLLDLMEFYHLDALRAGVDLLQRKPDLLTTDLKKKIVNNISSLGGNGLVGKVKDVGLETLEHEREYIRLVKMLAKMCKEENEVFDYLVDRVEYAFMNNFIETDLKNDFANLPAFYTSLSGLEKAVFEGTIDIYMDFIQDDLGIADVEEIKKRPLWQVLQSMGWADRCEKILKGS